MAETVEHGPDETPVLTTVQKPTPLGSLTAAASRLTRRKVADRPGFSIKAEEWQADAWEMYDLVGEFRFLATTLANRLAQARLYVGLLPDDPTEEVEPVEEGLPREVFESIGNGPHRTQAVGRLGLNLFTPGEGWLIGIPRSLRDGSREGDDRPDPVSTRTGITPIGAAPEEGEADIDINDLVWHTYSVSEVSMAAADSEHIEIRRDGRTERYRLNEVWPIRVWRPHPRRWDMADSPARSSLPVLRELVGLTMHISAQVDSRLAGAGVFLLPQSADRAARISAGLDEQGEDESPLAAAIMEAMLTPIGDRSSAAAVVPIMPVVPDESIEKFRFISFSTPLDAEARELRDEAIRRLALGLDCPPELLLGMGCVDTETTILTEQGWKSYDEVREGDLVLTLNHETGASEWQPILAMNVFERVAEPMLRMSGKGHDSLTTLNHRWAVTSANHDRREFVESSDLNTGHRIPTSAPHADLPTEAKYSDAFVELVAWFWTEGHYTEGTEGDPTAPFTLSDGRHYPNGHPGRTGRWGQASIAQSVSKNPGRVDAIRLALDSAFPGGWGTESRQSGEWGSDVVRFNLRKEVYETLAEVGGKHVSLDFIRSLTRAQLELFIDISAQGDGWHYSDGRLDIWQKDPAALDAYELALILSGRTVSRTKYAGGEVVNAYVKDTVRPIKSGIASEETYTGVVWCPTTENSTWLARRNGTTWFTGNSMNHWGAWLVKEDVVTTHIEPPLALICDALTTQFLWPVLAQQGMPEEEVRKHVIWYDVSHLVIRPNRTQDAKDLYAAGAINSSALRDAAGFDESDAPVEQERQEVDPAVRMALELVSQAPSLMQAPGLEAIVQQIRAVMLGEDSGPAADPGEEVPLEPVEGDSGDEEGGDGLPDPDESDGPPEGQDGGSPLTASSGAADRIRADEEGVLVAEVPAPPRQRVRRAASVLPAYMATGRGGSR